MHKVVILGAGMVAKPIADYLLENNIELTIASRTVSKAEALINGRPNGKTIAWTMDQLEVLEKMVKENDLVVSLLPYTHHVMVAKLCIQYKKNMVTTSYVSDEMRALDQEAKNAGIIILNEIGVDPGYDHMTAMRIIDRIHNEGGEVEEFYSLCGALAAPEAANNPLRYKFSWSPRGVVMAGNNDATFLKDGETITIPTEDLFKKPLQINFPEIGDMEVYPNRDSLDYINIYGIPKVKTMYRGTFRYRNWCSSLDGLKALNLTSYQEMDLTGKSYADFVAEVSGLDTSSDIKSQVARKLDLNEGNEVVEAMEWLGLFSSKPVHKEKASPFDIIADLMQKKMMLGQDERDMVIMQHIFTVKNKHGERKLIKSSMLDFGDNQYTSIAKTVAWPAAIAVTMILNGSITLKGVHIPIEQNIYEPILEKLEALGITMKEEDDLALSEKL
ncbi:saccharopine dehydrogenase C-terminal domain-containing protein [Fulvivirgaceae bacterium BMA10]|uniref:Saccharopine dehydrogenase C-terminal domain-containing protein n=1 Tax=Splendidivirga corallicola TaxID=3051826 RepID=A0ABT8KNN3_9BACT|nr:saccharopine dehydrogenase C-terminal domain-containing protein [Fulvivirgaceae bacterium BMA10]